MFLKLLLIGCFTFPPVIHSLCYSNLSQTWICDDQYQTNTTKFVRNDYHSVLLNEKLDKLFLTNHHLSIIIIDEYPTTLTSFNASDNEFQTIFITSKNRHRSNLRELIFESNNIRQFNTDTIVLPQSLEIISLANNLLQILDARLFSPLKKLTRLDLRNNRLKRILPELLLTININLIENPLECQCTPEFYQTVCEKSTNLKRSTSKSNNCMAPYLDPQKIESDSATYLRFATVTFICPISAQPSPLIIWSTPFGNLSSRQSSRIDLISSNNDKPFLTKLTTLAGPFTARTQHILHAFDRNHLSVTYARASLQNRLSCTGVNMLGVYTYTFDFTVATYAEKHALWIMLFTLSFGVALSLIGGLICFILKKTYYYPIDHLKTPPLYPTMTPNSAARTPPNFELNQWLSSAAANITGTLEQVRDRLRSSVQQAGGTIRQAAETSAAYLQSFRETSQQRFNLIRVQTLSSLRTSGHLMRVGVNMLTTQVNSLRDYCGITSGSTLPTNYLIQQQQSHILQHSNSSVSYIHQNQMPIIAEDGESIDESTAFINSLDRSPYAGYITSGVLTNVSCIGQLETADNSVLSILNSFNPSTAADTDIENLRIQGHMIGGIGTFHDRTPDVVNNEQEM